MKISKMTFNVLKISEKIYHSTDVANFIEC